VDKKTRKYKFLEAKLISFFARVGSVVCKWNIKMFSPFLLRIKKSLNALKLMNVTSQNSFTHGHHSGTPERREMTGALPPCPFKKGSNGGGSELS